MQQTNGAQIKETDHMRNPRDIELARLGINPTVAKIALRIQSACAEANTGRVFMVTNQGNGVWQLLELTTGKVEVVK